MQLVYIDGWHTFDYALLDFFYADKLLDTGGLVGFNDCHYPSIERVLRFVVRHRHYREVDVGPPAAQHRSTPRMAAARTMDGSPFERGRPILPEAGAVGTQLQVLGRVLTISGPCLLRLEFSFHPDALRVSY